jgi:ketosteroid isomerase-like protein
VRRLLAFFLLITVFAVVMTVVVAGCGDDAQDPTAIVESWSKAINASDDEAAANLFADDVTVIHNGQSVRLVGYDEALSFNASLSCGGRIVEQTLDGDVVTATFALTRRPGHMCDNTGQTTVALFRITDGKIALWHQLPTSEPDTQSA